MPGIHRGDLGYASFEEDACFRATIYFKIRRVADGEGGGCILLACLGIKGAKTSEHCAEGCMRNLTQTKKEFLRFAPSQERS